MTQKVRNYESYDTSFLFTYLIVLYLTIYLHSCVFLFATSPASHCVANIEKFVIIVLQFFAGM